MIIHLLKDNRDPDWYHFAGYDETGECLGQDPLRIWRQVFGAQLHRGSHPDESKIPTEVFTYLPGKLGRGQFNEVSVYWFETKERVST